VSTHSGKVVLRIGSRTKEWNCETLASPEGIFLTDTSRWEEAGTVGSFSTAAANRVLMEFVRTETASCPRLRILDVGCGAARNAAPMAMQGGTVVGTDVSWPMLAAARRRLATEGVAGRVALARASMDYLPLRDASVDLVVAHGIWNLARTAAEFRRAVAEAARVARPGAGLFLFTFSRTTLAPEDRPIPGEPFVFTQFAGEPQCFLTEAQVKEELFRAGWEKDPPGPLTEYNRPVAGRAIPQGGPVVYEGTFRRRGR
jgi:ubiquinone/menaquinone biosynthesis C-methylase UbiE